jgi:hypothetical protein
MAHDVILLKPGVTFVNMKELNELGDDDISRSSKKMMSTTCQ